MPIPQDTLPALPATAKERVFQSLRRWLADGTLEPGERLYEDQLSRYFHVSRTPVHEALQLLAEKGLVEILPGRGTRVTPIDLAELRQCYPLISHLHGYAVRLAFDRVNSQVLERLHQLNQHLQECIASEDLLKTQEADRQFHQIFLDLADNRYLSAMITDLAIHINRTELQFFKKYKFQSQSVQGHLRIMEALRQKDLEEAVQATEDNWMLNFRLVIEPRLLNTAQNT